MSQLAQSPFSPNLSPDERGGGGAGVQGASVPKEVQIGDATVSFDDLVKTYQDKSKFDQVNHDHAEENKKAFERLQVEKEAWNREREAAAAERLVQVQSQQGEPEPDEPFNHQQAISQIKLIEDEKAPEKLASVFNQALADQEQRLEKKFEESTSRITADSEKKIKELDSSFKTRLARDDAKGAATRHNDELFENAMRTRYPDIAEKLSEQEMAEVKETMRSFIHKSVGSFDENREWRWNDTGVDRAVRTADPSYKVLLARERANSRLTSLGENALGEEATDSTPTRQQRRTAAAGDEQLTAKMDRIHDALAAGEITPDQAADAMGDDAARILEVTRQAQHRGGV